MIQNRPVILTGSRSSLNSGLLSALILLAALTSATTLQSQTQSQTQSQEQSEVQSQSDFSFFRGVVLDAGTGQALVHAHILANDGALGTISNTQGEFEFRVRASSLALEVQHLGYRSQSIVHDKSEKLLTVFLEPISEVLKPVVITNVDVYGLLRRAIERVEENHQAKTYTADGFYRLTAWDVDEPDSLIHISEAAFRWFEPGPRKKPMQFALLKARNVRDVSPYRGSTNIVFGMSPKGIMRYSPVYGLEELLSKKGLKQHDFSLEGQVEMEGTSCYEIHFDQKESLKKCRYKGILWLDLESLAVVALDVELSPRGLPFYKTSNLAQRALMDMLDIHERPLYSRSEVRLRRVAGIWVMDRISSDHKIRIYSGRNDFDLTAGAHTDIVVTLADTNKTATLPPEATVAKGTFIEQQENDESSEFWNDYMIMLPDYDYATEAEGIRRREARAKAKWEN